MGEVRRRWRNEVVRTYGIGWSDGDLKKKDLSTLRKILWLSVTKGQKR